MRATIFLALALSLMALACGQNSATSSDTKTFTWEYAEGKAIHIDAPLDWEWDEEYNSEAEAKVKDGGTPARSLRVSPGELPYAVIALWDGPIDEWVEVAEESEGVSDHDTWKDKVNGVSATFRRVDNSPSGRRPTGSRQLEVYIMPEGNEWAWRAGCITDLADDEQSDTCEAMVSSIKLK